MKNILFTRGGYVLRGAGLLLGLLAGGCDIASNPDSGAPPTQAPDPALVDFPVAFVERPVQTDANGVYQPHELLDPTAFRPGARLIVKERAEGPAPEDDISSRAFPDSAGLYDVKDLDVSPDGTKLIFAMRAPEDDQLGPDEQPTWNIWEYDSELDELRRVIASDTVAEQGQDVDPTYLADGRIVFSSTRQRRTRAMLLDEDKPQYAGLTEDLQQEAAVLHVMDADGSNIEQITFNQSHDLHPTVLNDGRIAFLRWDNAARRDKLSLYTVNPDGTNLSILYGYHSQNTGTSDTEAAFAQPRQLPDGRLLVSLRPRSASRWGGDMVAIDTANYIDNYQPTADNVGASGPAQESQSALPVLTDGQLSRHGYFNEATPLFDGSGRMFVSWSQCRVLHPVTGRPTYCSDGLLANPEIQEAAPLYSLWIYDKNQETQLPVVNPKEGIMYTDPAVLTPRSVPNYADEVAFDADLAERGLALLHIRSVYDMSGEDTAPGGISTNARRAPRQRPARFLRIYKPVPIPDDDVRDFDRNAFGVTTRYSMREIIGYVPIEPDGSAKFQVPADTAFGFAVLDRNGFRKGDDHYNWLTLRPGEVRNCNGCHSDDNEQPHGRPDAEFASVNPGAPVDGEPFPDTQLFDEFGTPEQGPQSGESMAEYYARVKGPRAPSMDIEFVDEWDEDGPDEASRLNLRYQDIAAEHAALAASCTIPLEEEPPAWIPPATDCDSANWDALCRTRIHYLDSIQPLWEADRRICDETGNVAEDRTCTSCHTAGANRDSIPAAQLELTASVADNNNLRVRSYQELLFGDNEEEIGPDGTLVDVTEIIYETDENGEVVLDENGERVVDEIITFPVHPPMSLKSGYASARFFGAFVDEGGVHEGWLSPSEIKLLVEWIEIGGQYYNDPFAAPAN